MKRSIILYGVWGLLGAARLQAVTFAFTPLAGTPQEAIDGFAAAGAFWSARFKDPVTVNITIGYEALGSGILGSASSTRDLHYYSSVRTALSGDIITSDDFAAVSSLPTVASFGMYLNYTSSNPNGAGSATPYLDNDGDANNMTIRLTSANSKALGLRMADNPRGGRQHQVQQPVQLGLQPQRRHQFRQY